MKATVTIENITPKCAAKLLAKPMAGQRNLRTTHVQKLAQDMLKNTFRLSQDALVICRGELGNGQHRLSAVVKSNTTQLFLVLRTDDSEIYKIMDAGAKRRIANVFGSSKYASSVAAGASLACTYEMGTLTVNAGGTSTRRSVILDYIATHQAALEHAATEANQMVDRGQRLIPVSTITAFLALAGQADPEGSLLFMRGVIEGVSETPNTRLLRDRAIRERLVRGRSLRAPYWLAYVIKAYNAHCDATQLKILRILKGEAFPRLAMFPSIAA